MYTFNFDYGERNQLCEHIIEVQYNSAVEKVVVQEENILKHNFPLNRDMLLYSENKSYKVTHKDLISIEVTKELD